MEPTVYAAQGTLEDWKKLSKNDGEKTPERIVYLWNLDARIDDGHVQQSGRAALSRPGARNRLPAARLRFDLVTRDAQPAGRDLQPNAVGQAPTIGLMRVISNEHSKLSAAASIFLRNLHRRRGAALERDDS